MAATTQQLQTMLKKHPKDFYGILGLKSTANPSEVKKAYLSLAMGYHPDKHSKDTPEEKLATEAFKLIVEAHSVLSDAEKRRVYDRQLKSGLAEELATHSQEQEKPAKLAKRADTAEKTREKIKENPTAFVDRVKFEKLPTPSEFAKSTWIVFGSRPKILKDIDQQLKNFAEDKGSDMFKRYAVALQIKALVERALHDPSVSERRKAGLHALQKQVEPMIENYKDDLGIDPSGNKGIYGEKATATKAPEPESKYVPH